MTNRHALRGLYVITDRQLVQKRQLSLSDMVDQAIRGGARIIQYRNKQSALSVRMQESVELATLCRQHGVLFLVNDDVEIAAHCHADGVHIGQTDIGINEARARLGEDKIIGVTCHNELQLARRAQQLGADYVAFGRFYPSHSKPTATPASTDILRMASEELSIPLCAIGGINQANAQYLIDHGADMLAVIQAVLGAEDIRLAANNLAQLFKD